MVMDQHRIAKTAEDRFGAGRLLCAESVLLTVADEVGIISSMIPRIATGFCSGMADTGGMCGAVAGGIMALGMLYGRDDAEQQYKKVYAMVQRFKGAFEAEFGSIKCMTLTGCDFSTEKGRRLFQEKGMLEKCRVFTGRAASLVTEIIFQGTASKHE